MLEERVDCEYYLPSHYKLLDALNASPFNLIKLRAITTHIVDGPFGSAIKAEDYAVDGIPFIRVADVTRGEGTIKTDNLVFITHQAHEQILRSKAVPGDVIIAKTGATMGAASVLPTEIKEANIRGDLALVGSFVNPLHAHYLAAYINTSIGYRLFWRLNSGSTRGRVVISNLRKLPVLWPDDATQKKIVDILAEGREAKKQKEQEAQRLLNSIDDYLLAELGITLPPEPENTTASRIFTAQSKELAGWRFDARVHRYSFNLSSNFYPNVPLKGVVDVNPRTTFRNINEETMLTFLPMEAISDEDGSIVSAQERVFTENVGYTNFQEGDLLWAKITPCMENGKSAVAENLLNGYGFGSTEYHVLRPKSAKIDVHYLHALLHIKRLRMAATSYFGGSSGHQRVDQAFFRLLEIPLPDIATQQALVEHIEACRQESKCLRSEAENELKTAKRRIEAMLLGEDE